MKYCPLCRSSLESGLVDEYERLKCSNQDCGFVFWDNPIPVVAALVENGDQILLARNREWPEGMYSIITGFLEKGETPEEGALREVKEELGLRGRDAQLIGVYSFAKMNQVIIAYHVKADGEVVLGEELVDLKRIDKGKLKGWSFGTGLAVTDWVNQQRQDNMGSEKPDSGRAS